MLREPIERAAFGGHETFPLRYTWLPKAVSYVSPDSFFFTRDDAMVRLGVGKNMVRSIRYWGLACGVLEEDPAAQSRGQALRVTELGRRVFGDHGWDPYVEDAATIWLMHWQVAKSPRRSTTWYWAFNHLPQPDFSRADLLAWLRKLAQENGWTKASEGTIRRDVDCFVRSYANPAPSKKVSIEESLDSPLAELGLIREFGSRSHFLLMRGEQASLPDEVFAFAVAGYIRARTTETKTLPSNTVAFGPGSPGRVLCLDEDAVLARLERLESVTMGALAFDETAGLRQVLIRQVPEGIPILARHYERRLPEVVVGSRR
jgi:hypothetical protein